MKIQIITHNKCQLNCPPCIRTVLKPSNEVMSMETFYIIMEILPELDNVDLTPIMGDPFMDKDILERMDYLEQSPKVKHFDFVTNLVGLTPEILDKLFSYKKFGMYISVYGDDEYNFERNTGTKNKIKYHKFQENMEMIYKKIAEVKTLPFPITFYFRGCSYHCMDKTTSWLGSKIHNMILIFKHVTVDDSHDCINYNWGGQHKHVQDSAPIPRKRITRCLHSIEQNCIFPNGDVSICGMVDVNKKMLMGNILKDGMDVFNIVPDMILCKECNEYEPIG